MQSCAATAIDGIEEPHLQSNPLLRTLLPHWMEIAVSDTGKFCGVKIAAGQPKPAPVKMASHLFYGPSKDTQIISISPYLKIWTVSVIDPVQKQFKTQIAHGFFLEEVKGQSADQIEKSKLMWQLTAIFCGMHLRDDDFETITDLIIDKAIQSPLLLDNIEKYFKQWNLEVSPIDARLIPRIEVLLNGYEALVNERQLQQIEVANSEVLSKVPAHLLSMNSANDANTADEQPMDDVPMVYVAPTEKTAIAASGWLQEVGLEDRLIGEYASIIKQGLESAQFDLKAHRARNKSRWAVLLTVPKSQRSREAFDVLVHSTINPKEYVQANVAVVHIGKAKDDEAFRQKQIKIWKAACACLGIFAVTRSGKKAQGFSSDEVHDTLKAMGQEVVTAIRQWPIEAHQPLIDAAIARAQHGMQNTECFTVEDTAIESPAPRAKVTKIQAGNTPECSEQALEILDQMARKSWSLLEQEILNHQQSYDQIETQIALMRGEMDLQLSMIAQKTRQLEKIKSMMQD